MTKPVITNRTTKGTALTYSELDTNFSNLRNATIGVTDGTNTKAFDLNDTITFTAGTNVTLSVNPSTGAITINSSAGGSGTINTGASGALAYYPSAGTTLDDTGITYTSSVGLKTLDVGASALEIKNTGTNQFLYLTATGGMVLSVGFGQGMSINDIIKSSPIDGVASLQSSAAGLYSNNSYIDYGSFSGILLVRNQTTGNVALWLCGGSSATKLGDSLSNTSGTVAYNGAYNAYRWTNTTGSTAQFSFLGLGITPQGTS
jgi:hypothetical protein